MTSVSDELHDSTLQRYGGAYGEEDAVVERERERTKLVSYGFPLPNGAGFATPV